jgi:hypothetical protein
VTVDGMEREDEAIPLVDDRRNHSVEIVLRPPRSSTRSNVEAAERLSEKEE